MRITEATASAMPTQLACACSPSISARTDSIATYGASRKNWIGDEPLGALLGGVREDALPREAPDDDHAGEALDRRVQPEADERDRAGDDPGADRHRALDRHPRQRQPREQPHPAGQRLRSGHA